VWRLPSALPVTRELSQTRISVRGSGPGRILAARFVAAVGGLGADEVVLAVGSASSRPTFVRVRFTDADSELLSTVAVDIDESSDTKLLLPSGTATASHVAAAHGNEALVATSSIPVVRSSMRRVDDGSTPTRIAATKVEATVEERLKLLAARMEDGESSDDADRKGGAGGRPSKPQASSLHLAIEQALQTRDDGQLEDCLAVSQSDLVDRTVGRLGTASVVPFLTSVIHKFEARPSRGAALVPWIRAVLVQHTAYLMAVPGLVDKLSALYRTVDARLSVFKKLLKLSGRLELVLSQVGDGAPRVAGIKRARRGMRAFDEDGRSVSSADDRDGGGLESDVGSDSDDAGNI